MARFVYIDETGSVGTGGARQPHLTLVAAIVDEDAVQPLARDLSGLAMKHLGWVPADFEFHGHELWHASGHWSGKQPPELLAAYEDVIGLLDVHDIDVAHSSINKAKLTERYGGAADQNAYVLALQFLLEKVDAYGSSNKILIADEAKEQQLRAIKMVADMQTWGGGEVPGRQLRTVIDSMHFVSSHASPGVQMADMIAYLRQRRRRQKPEGHPDVEVAMARMIEAIGNHTRTYRQPWPT